jgi:cell shape-determining protein MreC
MESFQVVVMLLIIVIASLIYGIVNLLKTIERYEDVTQVQESILNVIKVTVSKGSQRLKEHDTLGHYNSEDDLGSYFKMLLEIDKMIQEYLDMIKDDQT